MAKHDKTTIPLHFHMRGQRATILAVIHEGCDWAAYIGATSEDMPKEEAETLVAERGDKLTQQQAEAFFPCIEERYRG